MPNPKILNGNPITDADPMQVQVMSADSDAVIGTPSDTAASVTILGRLINLLSRWPASLGQTTAAASTPVTLPSDGPLEILGTINGVTTLTRQANVTAYLTGDEVSNSSTQASAVPFVFANAGRANGGAGWITKVRIGSSDPLCVGAVFRLYLFDSVPTMVGDTNAYSLLTSEFGIREGGLDVGPLLAGVGAGGGASIHADVRMRYVCAAATSSLWGVLTIQGGYTPLSAGTFQIELTCDRDG